MLSERVSDDASLPDYYKNLPKKKLNCDGEMKYERGERLTTYFLKILSYRNVVKQKHNFYELLFNLLCCLSFWNLKN